MFISFVLLRRSLLFGNADVDASFAASVSVSRNVVVIRQPQRQSQRRRQSRPEHAERNCTWTWPVERALRLCLAQSKQLASLAG